MKLDLLREPKDADIEGKRIAQLVVLTIEIFLNGENKRRKISGVLNELIYR